MKTTPSTISLAVGLAIPIVMVLLIAAAVLLPGRSVHPTTNFVYAVGQYPSYTTREGTTSTDHTLTVKNGTLTETKTTYTIPNTQYNNYPPTKDSTPRFFIHDTAQDTNKEISIEEVQKLKLSTEQKSPDGFSISFGQQSYGVFPFFGGGDNRNDHAYLSNDYASKEVSLISDISIDRYSLQLVGWVLPN